MRLDVTMYVIAAIFFALAPILFIFFPHIDQQIAILQIIFGILTIIAGYCLRPKPKKTIKTLPPTTTPTKETTTPSTPAEETLPVEEPITDNAPTEETPTTEETATEEPTTETTTEETPQTETTPNETTEAIEDTTEAVEETTEAVEETTEAVEETTETPAEISTAPQEETPAETTQNDETTTEIEQEAAAEDEMSLTNVKGIGEKRAAQLNALGINTAKELAQASAEDLAEKLKISPKVAAKLIEAAKQQQ